MTTRRRAAEVTLRAMWNELEEDEDDAGSENDENSVQHVADIRYEMNEEMNTPEDGWSY